MARPDSRADSLGIAQFLFSQRNDPVGAEQHFRFAMGSPDSILAQQAYTLAMEMFLRVGDYAALRQTALDAAMRAESERDTGAIARAQEAQRTAEAMLNSGSSPLMQSAMAPTMRPLSEREERMASGVSFKQMVEGMGQMHGSRDPHMRRTFDSLNHGQEVDVELTGTLVRDQSGRFGVRDETTGRVTAVDFAWSREWALTVAAKDVGKMVMVTGTSQLWGEGRSMKVNGYYGAEHKLGVQAARGGFRTTDPRAQIAATVARQNALV
jgi:hypothetical protein